jgi:hypothetical protein
LRALLVKNLAAASAAAWHRQKDERPSGLVNRDGRDVRDDHDRQHYESHHHTPTS